MSDNAAFLQPDGQRPARQCPDCRAPLTMEQTPCPDGYAGCNVLHAEWACIPCRLRRRAQHERPATIGELNEISRKLDRLIEAVGLSELMDLGGR